MYMYVITELIKIKGIVWSLVSFKAQGTDSEFIERFLLCSAQLSMDLKQHIMLK